MSVRRRGGLDRFRVEPSGPVRRQALLAAVLTGVLLAVVAAKASATVRSGSGCDRVCAMAERVLAEPQQRPGDVNLFSSEILENGIPVVDGVYPKGSPMKPDASPIPSQTQMRAQLKAFLAQQLGNDATKATQALSLYDSPAVKRKIPNSTLRAAFVAMTGTSFQPTIGYFLHSGKFTTISYAATINDTGLSETADDPTAPGKKAIHVNVRYEHEPFPYSTALLGQEIQHTPVIPVSGADEAFVNYATAIVMAELLAQHPQLAYLNSEMARRLNDYTLAFLNSRHAGSAQTALYARDGLGLFPDSTITTNKDFWTAFGGSGMSQASPVARTFLAGVLTPSTHIPNPLDYDQQNARLFDHLQDPRLPPVVRLRLNVLLQSISVSEIARTLHLSAAQATKTFGLAPVLAVVRKGQYTS